MVMLISMSEDGVNSNLDQRFAKDIIYTYIGNVLVSVNPFKWLDIYSEGVIKKYVNKSIIDAPPHIFGLAEAAYRGMVTEEDNQCIIISGISMNSFMYCNYI